MRGHDDMIYVKMTIEEAAKICGKNANVLVAVQDMEKDYCDVVFEKRKGNDCLEMFEDAQTVVKAFDDFIKQYNIYTVKQDDIFNIAPRGKRKIILLRE